MFKFSTLVLAITAALALNGCSKCSNDNAATPPPASEAPAAPADAGAAAAPTDTTMVPGAPTDTTAVPAATPSGAM